MLRHALKLALLTLLSLGMTLGTIGRVLAADVLAAEESRMVGMVNDHRSSHGIGVLAVHEALRDVARRHAERMAAESRLHHNPDLAAEAERAIPGWRLLGENVGVGPSTDSVQRAFLNSSKHRHNIETQAFTIVAVGIVRGPDDRVWVTQNFAEWHPPATPTPPPPPADPPAPTPEQAPPPPAPPTPEPVVATASAATPETAAPDPPPIPAEPETQAAPPPDAAPPPADPEKPSLIETLLTLLTRLVHTLAFWE